MEIVEEDNTSQSPRAVSLATFLKVQRAGNLGMRMVHSLSMETIPPLSGSHLLSDELLEDAHDKGHDKHQEDARQDSPSCAKKFIPGVENDDENDDAMMSGYDGDGVLHPSEFAASHPDHDGSILSPRKKDGALIIGASGITTTYESTSSNVKPEMEHGFMSVSKLTEAEEPVALAPRFSQPLCHDPTALLEWNASFLSSRSMSGEGTVEAGSPTSTTTRNFLREVPCPSIPIQATEGNITGAGTIHGRGVADEPVYATHRRQNVSTSAAFSMFPSTSSQKLSSIRRSTEKPFLCRSLAWSQDSLDERRTSKRARKEEQSDIGGDHAMDVSTSNQQLRNEDHCGIASSLFQGGERREEPSPTLVHWEEEVVAANDLMDRAIVDKSTPTFLFNAWPPTTAPSSEHYTADVPPPIMAAASASRYSFDSC